MFAFFVIMFGLMVVLSIIVAILGGIANLTEKSNANKTLNKILDGKNIGNYHYQKTADNKILLDDKEKNILYVIDGNGGCFCRGYEYVTNVELSIDDSVAYQSSLSSAAGRAIVGGVFAGGVGAIIGGVTGKKNSRKIAHRITLTVSFSTPDIPYTRVSFLDSKQGVDVFSDEYKDAEQKGLYWSNLISSLMEK